VRTDPVSEATATPHKLKLSASDIATFLARGDASLKAGDIASARLFYEHCAEAGDAGSAMRLGETFDPVFLGRSHLSSASSDMEKALAWYRRAGDLGSSEAQVLLKQLKAN
jgi:TPR repeat protein